MSCAGGMGLILLIITSKALFNRDIQDIHDKSASGPVYRLQCLRGFHPVHPEYPCKFGV